MGFESLSRNPPRHAGFEDHASEWCGAETDNEPRKFRGSSENACTRTPSERRLDWAISTALLTTIVALIIGLLIAPREAQAHHHPWATTTSTWYGPDFYGNRTACGQRYTRTIRGVAVPSAGRYHLPCGTRLTLRRGGRSYQVRVIDTGGFRNHRFDLSARTAMDLCRCTRPYTIRHAWTRGWHTPTTRSRA